MKILIAVSSAVLLGACATTGTVTEQERARCERMAAQMSLVPRHDHNEEKGMGRSAMNRKHDQCRRILREEKDGQGAG